MSEPKAMAANCEHYYDGTRILGGHPLHVSSCYFCRKPDWDDLMEQAVELYRWGWQEGRAGKPPRDTLSSYDKPQEAHGPDDLVGAWATAPARYGADGCTCQPFTARTNPPRYLQAGDVVDQTTSWQQDGGCPHHGEQAERDYETPAAADFDRDPAALAWARSKVQSYIDQLARWEQEAKDREATLKMLGLGAARVLALRHFLGGGCTIGAFDERRPQLDWLHDGPSVREAAADDRRWPLEKAGE